MRGLSKIKTLDQVIDLARKHGVVYVRYSRSHVRDIKRGYSLNHQDKTPEVGLSCQPITEQDTHEYRGWIARLVADYAHILATGGYGWLALGTVAGEDADGCPALRDVTAIGRLDAGLVDRCRAFSRDSHNWRMDPKGEAPNWQDYGI